MWIVDLNAKTVHDMSRPQHECRISKISKTERKKIYTEAGVKRFLDDPMNKTYRGCQFCMPEFFDFDMNSIFGSNP